MKSCYIARLTLATLLVVILVVLLGTGSSVAFAEGSGSAKGGGSKRTTINFEDQLIEGQAQKPELFYLLQQRNNNFKRLIRLRENFLPEMRKSSEDIGRPVGGKGSGL